MQAITNQAPTRGEIQINQIKIPEPKSWYGARDAKASENIIFDPKQYFKATNTITDEEKLHLAEYAKLRWRFSYIDIQERRYTIDTSDGLKK